MQHKKPSKANNILFEDFVWESEVCIKQFEVRIRYTEEHNRKMENHNKETEASIRHTEDHNRETEARIRVLFFLRMPYFTDSCY
jgi:hypothetical protein